MMELFVFLEMGSSVDDIDLCFIHPDLAKGPQNTNDVIEFFQDTFDGFDIFNADCFDPRQRDQLLGIIEAGFGGACAPLLSSHVLGCLGSKNDAGIFAAF